MVAHSSSRIKPSLLFAVLILIFLLLPYILLYSQFLYIKSFDYSEFLWALKNSLTQGLLSALWAVALALPLSLGLLKIHKGRSLFEFFLQLPCFLPPLFMLLIFLQLIDPFPVGNLGVSLIQGFSLAGLIAIQFANSLQQQAGGMIETALVLGATRRQLWWQSLRLMKWQLVQSFLFALAVAFTSFSIPLAVGGGRGTNLEILIYEKIRISNSWGEALTIALIQSLFLLLLSQFKPVFMNAKNATHSLKKIGSYLGVFLAVLYMGLFMSVFVYNSIFSWGYVFQIEGVWEESLRLIPRSVFMAMTVALLGIGFLLLISWAAEKNWFRRFMNGYVPPSTAIVGFSILIFSVRFDFPVACYTLGFLLLSLNSIYRLSISDQIQILQTQQDAAATLGASSFQIWRYITLPQILPSAFRMGGLLGFWILGDFALGRLIFNQDATLAMHIESLMTSYRIDAALALSSLLVVLGIMIYTLFWGLSNVVGRRAH